MFTPFFTVYYSHTYRLDWFLSQLALTVLKYKFKVELSTQNMTHAYSISYLYLCTVYALFFKINSFFSEALFDASVSYHSYANI